VRRTAAGAPRRAGPRRFLLDTIGELRKAYSLADVVVMGRSFGSLYGSDPIEPIALGRPTVIGPAVGDFEQIVAAFEAGGGIARATRDTIDAVLRRLLDDSGERRALVERGRAVIRAQQGASVRHAEIILRAARRAPAVTS
jgi:3-deoxy-D-manno-octulosonic-acid transferase